MTTSLIVPPAHEAVNRPFLIWGLRYVHLFDHDDLAILDGDVVRQLIPVLLRVVDERREGPQWDGLALHALRFCVPGEHVDDRVGSERDDLRLLVLIEDVEIIR